MRQFKPLFVTFNSYRISFSKLQRFITVYSVTTEDPLNVTDSVKHKKYGPTKLICIYLCFNFTCFKCFLNFSGEIYDFAFEKYNYIVTNQFPSIV
jgi:hypothetical protein